MWESRVSAQKLGITNKTNFGLTWDLQGTRKKSAWIASFNNQRAETEVKIRGHLSIFIKKA